MKVKFLTPLAGANYHHKPGDIVTFADSDKNAVAEANRHIASGNARPLDDVETAMENARETAMLQRNKRTVAPPKLDPPVDPPVTGDQNPTDPAKTNPPATPPQTTPTTPATGTAKKNGK